MNEETGPRNGRSWPRVMLFVGGSLLAVGFAARASCNAGSEAPALQAPTSDTTLQPGAPAPPIAVSAVVARVDAGSLPGAGGRAIGATAVAREVPDLSHLPAGPVLNPLVLRSAGGVGGGRAIPRVDSRELSLFTDFERELKREPPPEVHGLIAEFRRGVERDELMAYVRQRFPKDLAMRAIALRWIDRVRPAPEGSSRPNAHLLSAGGGASWVAPIGKR